MKKNFDLTNVKVKWNEIILLHYMCVTDFILIFEHDFPHVYKTYFLAL